MPWDFSARYVNRHRTQTILTALLLATLSAGSLTRADITPTGDLTPDPATWTTTPPAVISLGNTSPGTLTISGISSLTTPILYVGNNADGSLNITNGGQLTSGFPGRDSIFLGYLPNTTGTVTVDGTGSTWATTGFTYIGYNGSGSLTITNGGAVTSSDYVLVIVAANTSSTGTVLVDGPSSQWYAPWIYVGGDGNGTLTITNGGTVTSDNLNVGTSEIGFGTLNISSVQSTLTCRNLDIGFWGHGALNISHSAIINISDTLTIGSQGTLNFGSEGGTINTGTLCLSPSQITGTGTINATGLVSDLDFTVDATHNLPTTLQFGTSTINLNWSSHSTLGVGNLGNGSFTLTDARQITCDSFYLGYAPNSLGIATITGSGTILVAPNLALGFQGNSIFNITNGAQVNPQNYNRTLCNSTIINVDGKDSLFNTGNFSLCNEYDYATINITNGGTVNSINASISPYYTSPIGINIVGPNSTWNIKDDFVIENGQSPVVVNIAQGGILSVGGNLLLENKNSQIAFGPGGGTINTNLLYASPTQILGAGTINTAGLVSDYAIIFDATRPGSYQYNFNGTTINFNPTNSGLLGVGYFGTGFLKITDGQQITSYDGILGYNQGSSGTAIITGPGSQWTLTNSLTVGSSGNGTLIINHGAQVIVRINDKPLNTNIGSNIQGSGTIWVDGIDSSFTAPYIQIGYSNSTGNIIVSGGASITCHDLSIGNGLGNNGGITVDGPGSTLNVAEILSFGRFDLFSDDEVPIAALNITNGGIVTVKGVTDLKSYGKLNFGASGGTLNTDTFVGSSTHITGSGTINTTSIFSDLDLTFDSTHGSTQTIQKDGVTYNLAFTDNSSIGVGYLGSATLTIKDGITVNTYNATLGDLPNSIGTANISGNGTIWNLMFFHIAQDGGTGYLNITNGATVNSQVFLLTHPYSLDQPKFYLAVDGQGSTWNDKFLGINSGENCSLFLTITNGGLVQTQYASIRGSAPSTASVLGLGSTWNSPTGLVIGNYCQLNILHGGSVNTAFLTLADSKPNLTLDVGLGSQLNISNPNFDPSLAVTTQNSPGTFTGSLNLVAPLQAPTGTYTPIHAQTWIGSGTVHPFGGTWDNSTHTFTINPAATATPGQSVTLDLLQTQRLLISAPITPLLASFPATSRSLGISFLARSTSTSLTCTVSSPSDATLALLPTAPGYVGDILASWTLTADILSPDENAYFTLPLGPGYTADALTLWSFNGTFWTTLTPNDFTYYDSYLNFTAPALGTYALTAVPEPASLALLMLTLAPLALSPRQRGRIFPV